MWKRGAVECAVVRCILFRTWAATPVRKSKAHRIELAKRNPRLCPSWRGTAPGFGSLAVIGASGSVHLRSRPAMPAPGGLHRIQQRVDRLEPAADFIQRPRVGERSLILDRWQVIAFAHPLTLALLAGCNASPHRGRWQRAPARRPVERSLPAAAHGPNRRCAYRQEPVTDITVQLRMAEGLHRLHTDWR